MMGRQEFSIQIEINRRIWDETIRQFGYFTPDTFNVPTPFRPLPRKPSIAAQNCAFQAAVRLLRLDPSVFTPKLALQPSQTVIQATPLNSRQRKSKVREVLDLVVKQGWKGQNTGVSTAAAVLTQLSSRGRLIRKKVLDQCQGYNISSI